MHSKFLDEKDCIVIQFNKPWARRKGKRISAEHSKILDSWKDSGGKLMEKDTQVVDMAKWHKDAEIATTNANKALAVALDCTKANTPQNAKLILNGALSYGKRAEWAYAKVMQIIREKEYFTQYGAKSFAEWAEKEYDIKAAQANLDAQAGEFMEEDGSGTILPHGGMRDFSKGQVITLLRHFVLKTYGKKEQRKLILEVCEKGLITPLMTGAEMQKVLDSQYPKGKKEVKNGKVEKVSSEAPAEKPSEAPAEKPSEAPAEKPSEAPATTATQAQKAMYYCEQLAQILKDNGASENLCKQFGFVMAFVAKLK